MIFRVLNRYICFANLKVVNFAANLSPLCFILVDITRLIVKIFIPNICLFCWIILFKLKKRLNKRYS